MNLKTSNAFMEPVNWLERKFDFSFQENIFPVILERLWGTPLRLREKFKTIPLEIQALQPEGKWSILENIGHLTDLEVLWQTRLQDILTGKETMTAWDVTNAKTTQANHNAKTAAQLIAAFTAAREQTLGQLNSLNEEDLYKFALHPRLGTPMRIQDLFLFVAEHDDHHLAVITSLCKKALVK